jgi:hypothetical protein
LQIFFFMENKIKLSMVWLNYYIYVCVSIYIYIYVYIYIYITRTRARLERKKTTLYITYNISITRNGPNEENA